MTRPRLLDLFCGAGGASMGYYRAGFDVVGVDIKPQPRYPFEFMRMDALDVLNLYPTAFLHDFDAIHASPPCQAFTSLKEMWNAKKHPDLVEPTRSRLDAIGLPYVIENVPGSPLNWKFYLCGSMFDLGAREAQLRRHRLFETTFRVVPPRLCRHRAPVIGVYGGHGRDSRRVANTQDYSTALRREAMGIDWMTGSELSQAIPPAYTEYIGLRLMEVLP